MNHASTAPGFTNPRQILGGEGVDPADQPHSCDLLGCMELPKAWLEFSSGERVYISGICTLGRAPGNRVVIAAEGISRRHAAIRENEDGTFSLMDVGSSNGTYLNGQRLSRPIELRDSWIIEIGSQKMTFRTPPRAMTAAEEEEPIEADCWLLVIAGVQRGCHLPSSESIDKTRESWSERCQRVITKSRGRMLRGMADGVLAFWPVTNGDSRTATVSAALSSLRAVQRHSEEFRFALHFGPVRLRRTATGEETPAGPEVIFALQLDRVASSVACPVLITETAGERLRETLPLRRLSADEARGQRGAAGCFTTVDP